MPNALARVWEAYRAGDLDEALRRAKAALQNSHDENAQDEGRLWEVRGLIHRDRGEPRRCADALERASLLVPLQPLARIRLAETYGRLGRRALARDLYLELLQNTVSVEWLPQIAVGLDAIDHPALAMQACRLAIQREPEQAQPYYDLGYYAARCGYPSHLVESLTRRAISLDPGRASFRVGLATFLLRQDRMDEAHAAVRAIQPDHLDKLSCRCCLERVISLLESVGDWSLALAARERLARMPSRRNPSHPS